MSRWIDADTLRSKLMQYIGLTNGFDRAFSEAPSIDIVRCGECEHRGADYCYKHSHRVTDSDFCSYGERCYIPYGERKEETCTFENDTEIKSCSKDSDLISRADALEALGEEPPVWCDEEYEIAERNQWRADVEAIKSVPSAEAVPQSEQYKKGFEDAKRAFLVEYARESENVRKRNAQLEVMLNAQKAILADRPKGEWLESREQNILMAKRIEKGETWRVCSNCGTGYMIGAQYEGQKSYGERFHNFCPNCGADMRGENGYERAIEQIEHDTLYESTYNPEDGSM